MLDGFPQRDFVLWVFMCPINIILFCVYSDYFVSLLSFPATTSRATTPHLYRTGFHAFTTTARLPRLSLSRLPRHNSLFYSWVFTPELSRSTTHVHRVITPAVVSSLFVVYLSPAITPPVLLHLHHHRGATRTNLLHTLADRSNGWAVRC